MTAPPEVPLIEFPAGSLPLDVSLPHINNRGQVAATVLTAEGWRGVLWDSRSGETTDLGTLGGGTSRAVALNEWGQVVGTSTTESGEDGGFLAYAGQMIRIDPLGGNSLIPWDINNWGQVVGMSETTGGQGQGFLWQNGRIVNLGELAGAEEASWAVDVNDQGEIVGSVGATSPTSPPQGNLLVRYPLRGDAAGVLWKVSPLWGHPEG